MTRFTRYVLASVAIAVFAIMYFYPRLHVAHANFFSGPHHTYGELRSYWEQELRTREIGRVKKEFLSLSDLPPSYGHDIAHAFGDALYKIHGLEGIAGCDPLFLYGCFHQLLANALVAEGPSILSEIDAQCDAKPVYERFSCNHGVGHGIIGMYGYTQDGLSRALASCEPLDESDSRQPCMDGVFMEYNLRELTAGNNYLVNPREYNAAARYEPCASIDTKYRKTCYFELPNWWMTSDSGARGLDGRVSLAVENCTEIKDSQMRRFCVYGFGHTIAPTAQYDTHTMKRFCEMLPTHREIVQCLSGAARRTKIERLDDGSKVCDSFGLSGNDLDECRAYEKAGRT